MYYINAFMQFTDEFEDAARKR